MKIARIAAAFVACHLAAFAAKQIIILDQSKSSSGEQQVHFLFWFAVPAGQQTPAGGFVSAYRGASTAELAALAAGSVVEEEYAGVQYPAGFTLAQIQADLVTRWTARNTARAGLPNPNTFYGANWDGTTWAAATGAIPGKISSLSIASATSSGTGNNVIVAGVAGQTIQVHRLFMQASGVATLQLKNGASNLGPAIPMVAGIPVILQHSDEPWFQISAGNAFQYSMSSGTVNGVVICWYRQF